MDSLLKSIPLDIWSNICSKLSKSDVRVLLDVILIYLDSSQIKTLTTNISITHTSFYIYYETLTKQREYKFSLPHGSNKIVPLIKSLDYEFLFPSTINKLILYGIPWYTDFKNHKHTLYRLNQPNQLENLKTILNLSGNVPEWYINTYFSEYFSQNVQLLKSLGLNGDSIGTRDLRFLEPNLIKLCLTYTSMNEKSFPIHLPSSLESIRIDLSGWSYMPSAYFLSWGKISKLDIFGYCTTTLNISECISLFPPTLTSLNLKLHFHQLSAPKSDKFLSLTHLTCLQTLVWNVPSNVKLPSNTLKFIRIETKHLVKWDGCIDTVCTYKDHIPFCIKSMQLNTLILRDEHGIHNPKKTIKIVNKLKSVRRVVFWSFMMDLNFKEFIKDLHLFSTTKNNLNLPIQWYKFVGESFYDNPPKNFNDHFLNHHCIEIPKHYFSQSYFEFTTRDTKLKKTVQKYGQNFFSLFTNLTYVSFWKQFAENIELILNLLPPSITKLNFASHDFSLINFPEKSLNKFPNLKHIMSDTAFPLENVPLSVEKVEIVNTKTTWLFNSLVNSAMNNGGTKYQLFKTVKHLNLRNPQMNSYGYRVFLPQIYDFLFSNNLCLPSSVLCHMARYNLDTPHEDGINFAPAWDFFLHVDEGNETFGIAGPISHVICHLLGPFLSLFTSLEVLKILNLNYKEYKILKQYLSPKTRLFCNEIIKVPLSEYQDLYSKYHPDIHQITFSKRLEMAIEAPLYDDLPYSSLARWSFELPITSPISNQFTDVTLSIDVESRLTPTNPLFFPPFININQPNQNEVVENIPLSYFPTNLQKLSLKNIFAEFVEQYSILPASLTVLETQFDEKTTFSFLQSLPNLNHLILTANPALLDSDLSQPFKSSIHKHPNITRLTMKSINFSSPNFNLFQPEDNNYLANIKILDIVEWHYFKEEMALNIPQHFDEIYIRPNSESLKNFSDTMQFITVINNLKIPIIVFVGGIEGAFCQYLLEMLKTHPKDFPSKIKHFEEWTYLYE